MFLVNVTFKYFIIITHNKSHNFLILSCLQIIFPRLPRDILSLIFLIKRKIYVTRTINILLSKTNIYEVSEQVAKMHRTFLLAWNNGPGIVERRYRKIKGSMDGSINVSTRD